MSLIVYLKMPGSGWLCGSLPRTLLCASAFRVGGSGAETGFDELRELCDDAGDKRSLAIGMTGLVASATRR